MGVTLVKFSSLTINCSNLEQSRQFYQQLGLVLAGELSIPSQAGSGYGIAGNVQWQGYRFQDHRGSDSVCIDLLCWQQPPTTDADIPPVNNLGYSRLAIYVPDIEALHQQMRTQASWITQIYEDEPSGLRWCYCRDPDGILLELVGRPGEPEELGYVVYNCPDLNRSVLWYQRNFALLMGKSQRLGMPPELLDGNEIGEVRSCQLALADDEDGFHLVLQQWRKPRPLGEPLHAPHHAGIFRLGFAVEDLKTALDCLTADGLNCSLPRLESYSAAGPADDSDHQHQLCTDINDVCIDLVQA